MGSTPNGNGNGGRVLPFSAGIGFSVPEVAREAAGGVVDRVKGEAGKAASSAARGDVDALRRQAEDLAAKGKKAVAQAGEFRDLSNPPSLLIQAVHDFTSKPSVLRELRQFGARGADSAFDAALAALRRKKAAPAKAGAPQLPAKPSAPTWMSGVVQPIANPVVDGFRGRLKERAMPYVKKAALVAGGVLVGTFLLGRWTAPKRAS